MCASLKFVPLWLNISSFESLNKCFNGFIYDLCLTSAMHRNRIISLLLSIATKILRTYTLFDVIFRKNVTLRVREQIKSTLLKEQLDSILIKD